MLEKILGDDFMEVKEVYEIAKKYGMKKSDVKAEKYAIGIKTVQIENNGNRMWLWYMPERIWNKYNARKSNRTKTY